MKITYTLIITLDPEKHPKILDRLIQFRRWLESKGFEVFVSADETEE